MPTLHLIPPNPFPLSLGVLIFTLIALPVLAQPLPSQPIPAPVTPAPGSPQLPEPLPPTEPPEISPPTPTTPAPPANVPETPFTVERFEFVGNTAFSQQQLQQVTQDFTGKPITFAQLLQAAAKITQLYIDNRYLTSGAYIPANQTLPKGTGVVKIQVVEGSVEEIKVRVDGRLNPNYVRSRIALGISKPLNRNRLQEALQLLQLNPLIESISAELSAGTQPGKNILEVTVKEANTFSTQLFIDNNRNPSVGTFRRGFQLTEADTFGLGDNLSVAYANTDGSNAIDASYTLPINARNGTISFGYSNTWSQIIEPPFNELDINSNSRNYEITLRQPIVQNATGEFIQELGLGLTANRRESDSTLLGVPFPLTLGADVQGNTRISAVRFFQDFTRRSRQQVLFARSQFSLGIDAFQATVNDSAPDSRFFAWRGQALWLRLLNPQTTNPQLSPRLLIRSDVQLATTELVPLEQFTLGGQASVRGYRQDVLLSDNGAFVSAELQWPVYNTPNQDGVLQVVPFVDFGTTWNSSGSPNPDPHTLASVGLGLRWQQGENFTIRLDYGLPLIDIDSRNRTLQEKGVYFSVQYSPF